MCVAGSPLSREDAWQRAVEFLFERLAVRWEIAGVPIEKQKELLQRFRFASQDERTLDPRRAARAPRGVVPGRGGAMSGGWRDDDTERFAALLCDWCLDVQPGQQVLVRSTTLAAPLLRALHAAILTRDAWPLLRAELPGVEEDFYALARERHLDSFGSIAEAEAAQADAFLTIQAPFNTRALADSEPAALARIARSRAPLTELRMAKRWCGTLWPTPAGAQQAGMSDDSFAAFVRGALFLDRDDPAAAWRELGTLPSRR